MIIKIKINDNKNSSTVVEVIKVFYTKMKHPNT